MRHTQGHKRDKIQTQRQGNTQPQRHTETQTLYIDNHNNSETQRHTETHRDTDITKTTITTQIHREIQTVF